MHRVYLILMLVLAAVAIIEARGQRISQKLRPKRDASRHWGYRNEDLSILPKDWHKSHTKCSGVRQSPINVESKLSVYNSSLKTIQINKTGDKAEQWQIKNNGHSSKAFK
jgi:carbonic anhydrase